MGVLPSDEAVVVRVGDPTTITVNCPNKLGLACDLTRVIFEFGLSLVRGDLSTDGRWCWLVFWAVPRITTAKHVKWGVLRNRLAAVCPPENQAFSTIVENVIGPKKLHLLQVYSSDRAGLLHDMSRVLWELELTVHKVKISTCPDGKAVDLFIVSDNRGDLHTRQEREARQAEVCKALRDISGGSTKLMDAGPEYGGLDCTPALNLPELVSEQLVSTGDENQSNIKVTIDNLLSPAHTLVQVSCGDRKGLLYDCLRTLKDFNLQVAYGRLTLAAVGQGEIDLFVTQADGRKIVDPQKQKVICARMEREVSNPITVTVLPRGPDVELIVATPIELCGRGRPRVLFDVTLALKMLEVCIFQADIGRHTVGGRQWEIYRFLVDVNECTSSSRFCEQMCERVRNILMG